MKFTPKTNEEIQRESLMPDGSYDFTVARAEDTHSKAGNEMLKVNLCIYSEKGSQYYVYDYLLEAMAWKLRHFAYAVGCQKQYDAGVLTASDVQGKSGTLRLVHEDGTDQYPAKNVVKDYIYVKPGEEPVKTVVHQSPGVSAVSADEPPF